MNLTDKHAAGLTLRMLGATGKLEDAKRCATETLYVLADRDVEWVNFIKEKYGVDFDFAPIRRQYEEAIEVVKRY